MHITASGGDEGHLSFRIDSHGSQFLVRNLDLYE
jgi:hypothetical protein